MGPRLQILLLVLYLEIFFVAAFTNSNDYSALSALMANWQQTPSNWSGSDPCGGGWEGIGCSNSRINSMVLSGMGLVGTLSGDIGNLQALEILDLSQNNLNGTLPAAIGNLKNLSTLRLIGCNFDGPIPGTIGLLTQLSTLSLASNGFTGPIPNSIGNLVNLYLLDLTDNKLSGTIPVSNGTNPGLDLLVKAQHFHLGKNQLTGPIPSTLFKSGMQLIHLLFDNNQLNGSIPSTLQLATNLEVIRLDSNQLSGYINLSFTSFQRLSQLYLSNNSFTGPIPDLSGTAFLTYVDMSNNSFDPSSTPSWFSNSSLNSLTSLKMENTQLQGQVPSALFDLLQLESVVLSYNNLTGPLDVGTNYGGKLQLIDLRYNSIGAVIEYAQGIAYNKSLMLEGNPYCKSPPSPAYCTVSQQPNKPSYTTSAENCVPITCSISDQIPSPKCKCAYPINGTLHFRSYSFLDFQNAIYYNALNDNMMKTFQANELPVDSMSLSSPYQDADNYLNVRLELFPSGNNRFNFTGFSVITSQLNNITFFQLPSYFGPFYFTLDNFGYFEGQSQSSSSSSTRAIIGATVGGSVLVVLLVIAGIYAFYQRKRAKRASQQSDPFASWDQDNNTGGRPQITGVRYFSFEELKKCTNNFSDSNNVGSGGYGKVYRGILMNGVMVAIKRAQRGSLQGSPEFKTEIELLSRLHHRNLVGLLGFCYEQGEQILVYEYAANGTLKDSLSGKAGIQLNWTKRLRIALDSARGLAYLHDLADPPIIHRDVKSTNILLDDQLIAKVADFGLSKLVRDASEGHISTQVKGTMGYLDPEYFMTNQLTEKSDVYSFGVVMLELITGRSPIEHGRYIVREVRTIMDKTKELYNLHEIIDPTIGSKTTLEGFDKFISLAIRCVEELGDNRPTMGVIVKVLEDILQLSGNVDKVFTLASKDVVNQGSFYPYTANSSFFEYSGSFPHHQIELQ